MKRYIRSNTLSLQQLWREMDGATQAATEYAIRYCENGYDIDEAVNMAVQDVNYGNAEPEYEDEMFYGDEADSYQVKQYLELKFGL